MKLLLRTILIIFLVLLVVGCFIAPTKKRIIEFENPPCIKPHHRYNYEICNPFVVKIDHEPVTVPANFDTDLASIPRWFWTFISPNYSGFVAPSILHDYLYQCPNYRSRKSIDEIFYYALIKNGVSMHTAYKMYAAVRLFGRAHYHRENYCIYDDEKKQLELIDDECSYE